MLKIPLHFLVFGVDFNLFVLLFYEFYTGEFAVVEMPKCFALHAQSEKVLYELIAQNLRFFKCVFCLIN